MITIRVTTIIIILFIYYYFYHHHNLPGLSRHPPHHVCKDVVKVVGVVY
jgi:hypothetical protein